MKNEKTFQINEISMIIGGFAVQAMIYEVSCYPSPGLVSPVSCGAHRDMNFFTFIDSTSVLSRYMTMFVQEGFSDKSYKEIFNSIRSLGIEAEKDMFIKTKGVNTHKGMLFLMGVTCAAVGKAIYEEKKFDEIKSIIKQMTKGIVSKELFTLEGKKDLSHGEGLFIKYKTEGVRGEVERGLPTVFNFSLDFYKKNTDLNTNDRLAHTLIGIMQICDDSTIIYRHSPEVLEEVKEKAREVLSVGGMKTGEGRKKINDLCNEFVEKNISPGGSADLLGVTVFLCLVEEYMKSTSNILNEILEAKEKRAQIQKELLNIFKVTLISFTLNIPGAEKNNESFAKLYKKGLCLLEEELKKNNIDILHKMLNSSAAGAEAFLSVDADAIAVKKVTVFIEENHKLGRLFDFDVFTKTGEQISRTDLGVSERKCLLCGENAKVCGRSRRHSVEDLLNKIYSLMDKFLSDDYLL